MPQRAFLPAPLTEAQPRVYRSFRTRQLRGLLLAAGGAVLALSLSGGQGLLGYLITFAAALPGFAYGYYQAQGKPIEHWILVLWRYHVQPRSLGIQTRLDSWEGVKARLRAARYVLLRRLADRRGRSTDGRS